MTFFFLYVKGFNRTIHLKKRKGSPLFKTRGARCSLRRGGRGPTGRRGGAGRAGVVVRIISESGGRAVSPAEFAQHFADDSYESHIFKGHMGMDHMYTKHPLVKATTG